jgi:hypothetical protein
MRFTVPSSGRPFRFRTGSKKISGLSGEIWHFTQPFLSSHAVGNLWALNYNPRKNLVFNFGFNPGLTGTSARWEGFAGFTSLLPHRILPP